MPALTLAVDVAEHAVRQSSGRHQAQFGGALEAELGLTGPWGVAIEVGVTGAGEQSAEIDFTQWMTRPAVLATLTLGGPKLVALFGVGPAVSITSASWAEPAYDAATFVEPGARGRAGLSWRVSRQLGVQLMTGVTSRGGGADVDLGLGLRWAL